ncbi:MAG: hypothetical protein ABJF23_11465 [Bryobacteraceae bacterium]
MQTSITDLMRAKTATFDSAARLRETLELIRIDPAKTQPIIRRFVAIGVEIRGPDDLPASRFE